MSRWILFLITIALGAAAGLYYGWIVNPVDYIDTAPNSLRVDYKADYVLMIAEAYRAEDDLSMAVRRLAVLGGESADESVAEAIRFAVTVNPPYNANDLALMQDLAQALQSRFPSLEAPTP